MFEQFFLNGKYSDQEKLAITRHALWPVYAALHNVSEGKIRIAELTEAGNMHFALEDGLQIGFVYRQQTEKRSYYALKFTSNPFAHDYYTYVNAGRADLRSDKPKYLANKIKTSFKDEVKAEVVQAEHAMIKRVSEMISRVLNDNYPKLTENDSSYERINGDLLLELALLAEGEITSADLSQYTRAECASRVKERKQLEEQRAIDFEDVESFYSRDKVLITNDLYGGINVTYCPADICKDFLNQVKRNRHTDFRGLVAERTLHGKPQLGSGMWYKSLDDLPEDLRTSVMASLAMLKAHTGQNTLFPRGDHASTTWRDMGASAVTYWAEKHTYMIEV